MKNILITGANGQLGNCLRDLAKEYQDKYRFFYTASTSSSTRRPTQRLTRPRTTKGTPTGSTARRSGTWQTRRGSTICAFSTSPRTTFSRATRVFRTRRTTRRARFPFTGAQSYPARKRFWRADAGRQSSAPRGSIPNTATIS